MKRFWNKVDKSGDCWLWTAAHAGGRTAAYGVFRLSRPRRMVYAHRFSYEMTNGPIPSGLQIRHTCDTPLCVNPDHMLLGTVADNARDKVERGRAPKPNAILVCSDIPFIRERLAAGELHRTIAADYEVGRAAISQIARGASWK